MNETRRKVIESLLRLTSGPAGGDAEDESLRTVRAALLAFGSETEDNVRAVESLEIVASRNTRGLAIRGASASLADIIHTIEDLPVPKEVRRRFPNIDQGKWESSLRAVALLLLALEFER